LPEDPTNAVAVMHSKGFIAFQNVSGVQVRTRVSCRVDEGLVAVRMCSVRAMISHDRLGFINACLKARNKEAIFGQIVPDSDKELTEQDISVCREVRIVVEKRDALLVPDFVLP